MTMIPVGSGEQSEINSLEKQIRSEYSHEKAPKKPPPKRVKNPKAGAPRSGQMWHNVAVTPRGSSVDHHNAIPRTPTNLPNQPIK